MMAIANVSLALDESVVIQLYLENDQADAPTRQAARQRLSFPFRSLSTASLHVLCPPQLEVRHWCHLCKLRTQANSQ
jgi:hypothetical protein